MPGIILILACLFACRSHQKEPPSVRPAAEPMSTGVLTLGDINPDQPVDTIRRLQPLADYLAEALEPSGIDRVEIVVARSIEGMAGRLTEGSVDVFYDSVYPSLAVHQRCDSEIVLHSWSRNSPDYWSVFIVRADSEIDSLDDLRGGNLAFEEPYSTSGFMLPLVHLAQLGLPVARSDRRGSEVPPDAIHYFFSRDASNTVELVQRHLADAGAISNEDLNELPQGLRNVFRILAETDAVPRRLVSIHPDLDSDLKERIVDALLGLAEDREPVRLEESPQAWAFKFDRISNEARDQLAGLEEGMKQLAP